MEARTIYGDGQHEVVVDEEAVTIIGPDGNPLLKLSRAVFREIVLGWERVHEEEAFGQ